MSDKARVRISDQDVVHHCEMLANVIKQHFRPEVVVAIDTGGSIPGELVGQFLGISVLHVVIRRDIKMSRRYSLDPVPIRWIMSLYHHYLFQTVKPVLSVSLVVDISKKRVLIVDDTIHTGATIDVTVAYLKKNGVDDIRVASLAHVSRTVPDFSILPKGNYCFPWSRDYKETD